MPWWVMTSQNCLPGSRGYNKTTICDPPPPNEARVADSKVYTLIGPDRKQVLFLNG